MNIGFNKDDFSPLVILEASQEADRIHFGILKEWILSLDFSFRKISLQDDVSGLYALCGVGFMCGGRVMIGKLCAEVGL